MVDLDPAASDEQLTGAEIRGRALSAAVLISVRGVAVRALGMLSYLVLARVLTPSDLGTAAVGLSFAFLGGFIADAGLGAALIRGPVAPSARVLRALSGLQLSIVLTATLPFVAWVLLMHSQLAVVSTLYVVALTPTALRAPIVISLERRLDFGPVILAEIVEVLAFNVVALPWVVLGGGVIALGGATIVKAIIGTLCLSRASKIALVAPSFNFRSLRPTIGFGMKVQSGAAVVLARDQILNYGTVAVAGLGPLGIWTLASKLMTIPGIVLESVWRVSYPTFARLIEAGEDLREFVARGVGVMAVLICVLMVPMAAGAPQLLPALLGDRWHSTAGLIPWLALGVATTVPISTITNGLFFARGEAGVVIATTVGLSLAMLVVGLGLLPFVGVEALGIGFAAGCAVDAAILGTMARKRLAVNVYPPLIAPLVAGVVSVLIGRAVTEQLPGSLLPGLLAVGGSMGVYLAAISVVARSSAATCVRVARRMSCLLLSRTAPSDGPVA